MEVTISSNCTTPSLSRTSTYTDASSESDASTCGIYTPSDISRQSSVGGANFKDLDAAADDSLISDSINALDVNGLEQCLEDLEGSSSLRASVRSAMKRAGTIVKNKLNVSRTLRQGRSRILRQSINDGTFTRDHTEVDEIMANTTRTPRHTPDIPSIQVQDMSTPHVDGKTASRSQTNGSGEEHLSPGLAKSSAYPFALNPEDNVNVSETSLLAVCGSPTTEFQEDAITRPLASNPWVQMMTIPIRIILFVPWCALVGAFIVLAPTQINKLTPSTPSLFMPTIPSSGPRRFSYWGECALYHILIFIAPILFLLLGSPMNAVAILAVVMAGCFWEWRDFVLDIRRETRAPVELGWV
ncbi:unnamed protein product [Somion occarium]|uniref:Uncharacterized protein n=1 Tax=Somion occarium TaxID=3059160 RepID=A0ABP1CS60_9APHY